MLEDVRVFLCCSECCLSTSLHVLTQATTCQVTVYEHWPENITAGTSGLEAAGQAWGEHFPTGATMVLDGTGDKPLGTLSNLTSSVKVQGTCCKAYAIQPQIALAPREIQSKRRRNFYQVELPTILQAAACRNVGPSGSDNGL